MSYTRSYNYISCFLHCILGTILVTVPTIGDPNSVPGSPPPCRGGWLTSPPRPHLRASVSLGWLSSPPCIVQQRCCRLAPPNSRSHCRVISGSLRKSLASAFVFAAPTASTRPG
ncbi:hypothetical protein AAHA92_29050 [Salvia divinorum]|uniref:Secreted protein n=1 Tax=Salvia divinorum TaxID=28513 RepID=A0ABD1FX08_SALDI